MKRFTFLGILVCLGCGVDDVDLFSTHSSSSASSCGYNSSSVSSGTGGITSSGSSGGDGGCLPKVTCQSVGAECGTILDDGCGTSVDCGNNCSTPLICGGGGQQFKCGCTPKTCFQLGKTADQPMMDAEILSIVEDAILQTTKQLVEILVGILPEPSIQVLIMCAVEGVKLSPWPT